MSVYDYRQSIALYGYGRDYRLALYGYGGAIQILGLGGRVRKSMILGAKIRYGDTT